MNDILQVFQYDFLLRAFFAGLAVAFIAPVLGTFLVVRRFSFLADTLAHVSLLGVAVSILFGVSPVVGAVVVSLLSAISMERLRSKGRIMNEAVLALFLSVSLAGAVILISVAGVSNVNLMSYLFGSLATVSEIELWFLLALAGVTGVFFLRWYRPLFLISLDEDLARASGVRVGLINGMFVSLAALAAAASLQIVGVLLLGALMVIPVLSALQFGRGFRGTIVVAVGLSLISFLVGFSASYLFDLPAGGAIVLSSGALFLCSLPLSRFFRRSS